MFSPNTYEPAVSESDEIKSSYKRLKLEQEFLIYLDQENILKDLQLSVIHYEKSVNGSFRKLNFLPPFRFKFNLDLIKIQEISEKLYILFLREPRAGTDLARNVIFCGVQLLSNTELSKSDLQIIPLITNLPITREISDLLKYPSFGLESVQGVLISKTTVAKYVRSSVYSCELSYCPRRKWQRYPQDFGGVCPECSSSMEEDVSSSDAGEEVICQFLSLRVNQTNRRFQVLNVTVRDELCNMTDIEIGEEYKITGRLNNFFFFEAMNVKSVQLGCEFSLKTATLPESIANLYHLVSETRPNCPWSFVYALSSPLGSDLIPTSSYLHLKMGLMLSLCSQKNNNVPVPLVAIGSDSVNAQYLFQIAGKLARRYVRHSIAHSYLGGAAKPGLQSDVIWLEAGQLILASTGICNLGDWSKFKKEQADYICQTIESGQIVLNKGDQGNTNLIDIVPLRCAVWTYWCPVTTNRSHQMKLKTLFNIFGVPFLAEERNQCEVRKICWNNLEKAMNNSERVTVYSETIPQNDLKELIDIINFRDLILSDTASQLISNYFVVSRQERPQCLPLGAIKTITSLAEAHARLALRSEVLYEDVVAIIYLYEEAISTFFGESVNSFPKLNWNQEEPIYVYMSKQLQRFKVWLEDYLSI